MRLISKESGLEQKFEQVVYDALTNNGIAGLPTEDKHVVQFEFKDLFNLPDELEKKQKDFGFEASDLIATKDLTRFIETSITRIVMEAIEPNLVVVPNLFQTINYQGQSRAVEIGGVGAFHAGTVAEGAEYPQVEFNFGEGDMVQVGIEKHGLKLGITEEVLDENMFDIMGLWLRMAGRALARHREEVAISLINSFGIDVFNNAANSTSELGKTFGRGIDGKWNDTMNVDDIFEMYAYMALRGFVPDVLLMSPLAWKMFMTDPEVREIVLKGATLATNRLPSGTAGLGFGTGHAGLGLRRSHTGIQLLDPNKTAGNNPFVTTINPLGATFEIAPRYLPTPLRVVVSPHVRYEATAGTGSKPLSDITLCDSSRCGILLEKESIRIDEWDDPERDIKNMKLREKWGMALFEQGKGVGVARNITIDRNYVFDNSNTVSSLSSDRTGTGITA